MKQVLLRELFETLSKPLELTSNFFPTIRPLFIHGLSASFHLLFLLIFSVVRICMRSKNTPGLEHSRRTLSGRDSLYKSSSFSCLGLFLLHLFICNFNYYSSFTSIEIQFVTTQLDLLLRTLVWLVIFTYLVFQTSPNTTQNRFPLLLRIWWSIYLFLSFSFIVFDLVCLEKHQFIPIHSWVLDSISILISGFLCFAGFSKRSLCKEQVVLVEPLLNGGDIANEVNLNKKSESGNTSLYSTANLFSILTFSWIGPLLSIGYKKALDLDDVPQLSESDSVNGVYPVFRNKLEFECSSTSAIETFQLVKALLAPVWKQVLLSAFFALLYTIASYVGPYLIDSFVQYLNGSHQFKHQGYVLVSIFFIAKLVECFAQRHWFFKNQQFGMRWRAALVAMIYQKGLTLSSQSRQGHTIGEIINFMSVDADRIGEFSWYLIDLWLVPFQVTLALILLYKNLGLASIAALVATIAVMVSNFPLGSLEERFQSKLMDLKDRRMKSTSEILKNMRILKLQGWEMSFLSKILDLRKEEISWLRKYVYTSAVITFIYWGSPACVSVVSFGACLVMGIPLVSGRVLSALATFRILQEPIYNLPDTISMVVQTKVSLDRISSFLRLEDIPPDAIEKLPKNSSEPAIEIINGNFSWNPSSANPTLEDLNFGVFHGMRVAVCGTVGSGKSSLLSCILGEVPKTSGRIKLRGTTAYVAQSPWIQSGTIVDNILFGKEMERDRYENILEACSLRKDLEILSFGDETVIGERGINLSGGQKQRIQIARALYQDADIYLFDDPFSAVDAHTGTHIFQHCLLGLLSSKTVIYVTHQVEFLPAADLILVIRDGRITQSGKYESILTPGTDFMELVGAHKEAVSALDSIESNSPAPSANEDSHKNDCMIDCQNSEQTNDVERMGQLVQEEEREKGKVGFRVYWQYITAAYGGAMVPFILLAQILFQLLQISSNYWMAWAAPTSEDTAPLVSSSFLIIIYVVLAIASSFCVLLRAMLLVTAGYKTATLLFKKMHICIFRSPMSFFDATPSGRILNRASTDQTAVDISVPSEIGKFAFSVLQLVGIIGVMSQIAWPVFIIFIPVIAASMWCQKYYIVTARELSRLVGICNAPIIQHFSETVSGSTTIRSFDQQSRFMTTNLQLIDSYTQPKFHAAAAMEWLCVRVDMLSSIVFVFCLVFLISLPMGLIDPSIAGLAVTYGLNLNTLQARVMWTLCTLENKIISVERILQYTNIPSEPPLVLETNRPGHNWPLHGEVDIHDLQVRYAPHMPLVLRGLTCTFFGGTRTGIVGRTGSGKSTLVQTLFRIVGPTRGRILIDGIDISSIGLHDLRSKLSIIPQDPTMFEGTVRSNLDPLEEYTDDQIWEALDKCQLGEEVRQKEGKLDSTVTENGENWSVGQRQLVCLGRVLLKRSKILVLDEATASVDTATDTLIQLTLREHFSHSTVITIAHRISSVLDSDMVLVLDNGAVAEHDTPTNLLEDRSSAFAKLVAEYTMRSREL